MPTSSRLPTRPRKQTSPVVGGVILDKIFNNVLFPEPFFPIIPNTSPFSTEKLISLSAQNTSLDRVFLSAFIGCANLSRNAK